MISAVETDFPSNTPPLIIRSGCSFWKFFRLFAASIGSPLIKATADGPTRRSSDRSTPAAFAAILVRVFFTTEYLVSVPSDRRSSFIEDTVRPRYSVRTVALALRKSSVSSATAVSLSERAISSLSTLHHAGILYKIKNPRRISAHEVSCVPMRALLRELFLVNPLRDELETCSLW